MEQNIKRIGMSSNIVYPVHRNVLLEIRENYPKHHHRQIALSIMYSYYEKLLTNYKDAYILTFVDIRNDKFNAPDSKLGRRIQKEIIAKYFDKLPHSKGNFSTGYRLKLKYLYSPFISRIYKSESFDTVSSFKPNDSCRYIDPSTYDTLLRIDLNDCNLTNTNLLEAVKNRATEIVKTVLVQYTSHKNKVKLKLCGKNLPRTGRKGGSKYTTHDAKQVDFIYSFDTELTFNRRLYRMMTYLNRSLKIGIDETGRRLNSNLTNIPSELIQFMKLDGEPLKEIDMKNCHYTLFSNALLYEENDLFNYLQETTKGEYGSIYNTIKEHIIMSEHNRYEIPPPNKSGHPIEVLTTSINSKYSDLINFINWSISGVLYENLAVLTWGKSSSINRNRSKQMLMEIFYGDPLTYSGGDNKKSNGALRKKFKELFPTVVLLTDSVKNYTYNQWTKVKDYDMMEGVKNSVLNKGGGAYQARRSVLPVLLLNIESNLFIRTILPKLREQDYDSLTKHDSIIVKESEYEEIKTKMKEVIVSTFLKTRFKLK